MGRTFEYTEDFDVTVEEAYAALTDENLWNQRMAEAADRATVTYEKNPDGGFSVTMAEGVGAQVLPGVVKKVIRGDLTITRKDTWGPLEGDHASGTLEGGSTGLPAKVHGTFSLDPSGPGARLRLTGTAEVKMPLAGGKIEGMIVEMIGRLVQSESAQAREYLQKS